MTILSAMQRAAMRLVGYSPSVFFSSSETFEAELVDLINEAAQDICATQDWQALTGVKTFTGDGVNEDFSIPSDYSRQLIDSDIQDLNNWAWGYCHLTDMNQFLYRKARGFEPYPGGWIIYGGQFHFSPAPASGQTATFPYISKNYAISADSTVKPEFTRDDDSFIIDGGERLLTLWLIWRWRENKKLDATGDQENFMKAMSEIGSRDRGSNVIRRNWSGLNRYNWVHAWPWQLGE